MWNEEKRDIQQTSVGTLGQEKSRSLVLVVELGGQLLFLGGQRMIEVGFCLPDHSHRI